MAVVKELLRDRHIEEAVLKVCIRTKREEGRCPSAAYHLAIFIFVLLTRGASRLNGDLRSVFTNFLGLRP